MFQRLTFIVTLPNSISATPIGAKLGIDDVERARRAIVGTAGKRLRYQRPASDARAEG
jgi:hypothetical protein